MSTINLEDLTPDEIQQQWIEGLRGHFNTEQLAPNLNCLVTVLRAMKWRGPARHIADMLPFDQPLTVDNFRGTLAKLGYRTHKAGKKVKQLSDQMFPCLHVAKDGTVRVVLGRPGARDTFWSDYRPVPLQGPKTVVISDGSAPDAYQSINRLPPGMLYILEAIPRPMLREGEAVDDWVNDRKEQLGPLFKASIFISFVINLLALVVPISIMLIYDQVIGKESELTLYYVVGAVIAGFFFEIIFRALRCQVQAYAAARVDFLLGAKIFEQIVLLPASFTERAPVGGQISRIREFETFREFFTGSLAAVLLDLPFVVIFVVAIAWIAGPLVIVPVVLAFLLAGITMIMTGHLERKIRNASRSRSERLASVSELTRWLRPIKQAGMEAAWEKRVQQRSSDAVWLSQEMGGLQAGMQNLSQALMMLAGVAILSMGAVRVMDGDMSLGALIATMILVWRILQPIQTVFGQSGRIKQVQQSFQQLRRIMASKREQEPLDVPSQKVLFKGAIEFDRVSMRYNQTSNPALLSVSFRAEPGEMIGIGGSSGSGKSTLASVAAGVLSPQVGAVLMDEIDIRQLRPITLRQTIAFVPQRNYVFPGTLRENLLLSDPTANMKKLRRACAQAGLLDKIDALPNGFETRFREGMQTKIPQSFLQQLALARALLRDATIIIMDEPASALDEVDEAAFLDTIKEIRGKTTIVMVSQRPSHMRMCDKLVMMEGGQVTAMGTPDQVLGPVRTAKPALLDVPAANPQGPNVQNIKPQTSQKVS